MKKWIIGIVVLAMVFCGWRVGARWYALHKLYRDPEASHRVAVVPTELDLSQTPITHGVTCNVGYAEFVIPSIDPVDLKASTSGLAVLGRTEFISLAFLIPFDPSASDKTADSFKKELSKLPESHPLRVELASPDTTFLDLQIHMERAVPEPFWKMVSEDSTVFAFNTMELVMKGSATGLGMQSVHTYHTPETRGLILVGEKPEDMSRAHVSIENRTGTQAVGMRISTTDGTAKDIMEILPVILKTFCFKVEHVNSNDDVKKLIAQAGLQSDKQEKENPASQVQRTR